MKARFALWFALGLLAAGCGKGDSDLEQELVVPVSVQDIQARSIEEFITTTGTVHSSQKAELMSEAPGTYALQVNPGTRKPFAMGDPVKAGTVLIRLEDAELETNIQIDSKRLNLEISKNEFEKQQSLYQKGGVTLRELKNAELSFINAKYSYDNAVFQLAKMDVQAPFDGTITELPFHTPGVRIAANLPMATVQNYGVLYMDAALPGKDLNRVAIGQKVRVINYTMSEDTLSGRVEQVSPAVDPATRTFRAQFMVRNPGWILRPGMFVKAELVVAARDSAVVIPRDVILSRQRGKTVFVVEEGVAVERLIVTGLENPDFVEVLEGLRTTERLVVKGFETLNNRMKVRIIR